ncbi:cornifelin-like [Sphaeramia orbicularis]|uniref:Cornifelin-like n=1 Tax=Sphaeramia orbicularis TaxID=375764 RepID=A0A672YC34_9TELE|nr:cornifelin-like [Sphaeramia orbicularis]
MPQIASETEPFTEWTTHLCDCFEDVSTCCYGFWCCPCLACTVSGRFGENYCLPICDILTPSVMAACGIPVFVPPAVYGMRASIRNRYKIKGSLCKDIGVSCFCVWCAWCQMHRELKHRNKAPAVVNMQNQTVINMQPQMMMPVYPNSGGMVNQAVVVNTH